LPQKSTKRQTKLTVSKAEMSAGAMLASPRFLCWIQKRIWHACLFSISPLLLFSSSSVLAQKDVTITRPTVSVGGRKIACKVVTVNIGGGRIVPRLVTARGGLGRTESFASMMKRTGAVAAINGSFFDAYNKIGDKDPNMTLIRNGQIIHKGTIGSVIGFTTNEAFIARLNLPVRGSVSMGDGKIKPWYAYWFNRTPTAANNICIFTPARGARTRTPDGVSVIVENDVVTKVTRGDVAIPPTGFVIHFRGVEEAQGRKFPVGARVGFRVAIEADSNNDKWQRVIDGVGAGPRLVTNGNVTCNPVSEGFAQDKILSLAGMRSGVGITRDGRVMLVTAGGVTVRQFADVMQKLGAYQAMNLDGGASSALYANGTTLTPAGRDLSNALMFVKR
jgi:hypothetical protein